MIKEKSDCFVGKKFNMLTIVDDLGRSENRRWVNAVCDCGTVRKYRLDSVKDSSIKCCGCVGKELFDKNRKTGTHQLTYHPLYGVWEGFKKRCYNPNNNSFKDYGLLGVRVCDEWLNDFKSFYEWAISNGYRKGLQIDKDKLSPEKPGKLYCPEYCCFLTRKENSHYKKSNRIIEHEGVKMCISEWCEKYSITYGAFKGRLKRGWSMQEIISTPVLSFNKKLAS